MQRQFSLVPPLGNAEHNSQTHRTFLNPLSTCISPSIWPPRHPWFFWSGLSLEFLKPEGGLKGASKGLLASDTCNNHKGEKKKVSCHPTSQSPVSGGSVLLLCKGREASMGRQSFWSGTGKWSDGASEALAVCLLGRDSMVGIPKVTAWRSEGNEWPISVHTLALWFSTYNEWLDGDKARCLATGQPHSHYGYEQSTHSLYFEGQLGTVQL